jgi:hypothetical protein
LLEEVAHFFTHIEKHFLKTTFLFIVRPGQASIDFLSGKRKKFQKPVSFFLIWTAAYILLHNYVIKWFDYLPERVDESSPTLDELGNELLRSHFTAFFFPIIFISSVIIYLVLAGSRFNFIEVFTLSLYGAGCFNVILIVIDLVAGIMIRFNINTTPVFILQTFISGIYNLWFCYDLFKRVKMKWFWLRLLLDSILISVAGYIVFIYFPKWWIILFT